MRKWTEAFVAATLVPLLAMGCGQTRTGGGAGSETHWLTECDQDSDCGIGSCLCGVCTMACSSLRDCPDPLDTCSNGNGIPGCDLKICASSQPAESRAALSSPPSNVERFEGCNDGRIDVVTHTDVGLESASRSTRVIRYVLAEQRGFLLFGGDSGLFYRIDERGNLLRTLRAPPAAVTPQFDSAAALEDGSLLLGGHLDGHAWLEKIDASWNVVWQRELQMPSFAQTQVVALPDGEAVVVAADGMLEVPLTLENTQAVRWARVSSDGTALWEREEPALAGNLLAPVVIAGDSIRIAVGEVDGVHLVSSDLEGSSASALIQPGVGNPTALLVLPDEQLAVVSPQRISVIDASEQPVWQVDPSASTGMAADAVYDPKQHELIAVGNGNGGDGYPGAWLVRLNGTTGELVQQIVGARMLEGPSPPAWLAVDLRTVEIDGSGKVVVEEATQGPDLELLWLNTGACGAEAVP